LLFQINGYQEANLFNFLFQFAHLTATIIPNNGSYH